VAFINTIFPPKIAYGSSGGPRKNVRVAIAASGFEQRISFWDESLRVFDISYGIRNLDDLYEVLELFEVVDGKKDFFLFTDNSDFKSVKTTAVISDTDVVIGTGNASETNFQLIKEYIRGATTTSRIIRRPIVATVIIALDSVPQPTGWTVSATTGIVNFSVPPGASVVVTAGYEFYVPVRFDIDDLSWILSHFKQGIMDAIILREIRE